jgi:hypothetical protein
MEIKSYYVCRVYSPYNLEKWAIAKPGDALYLDKFGHWNLAACGVEFGSRGEAIAFAEKTDWKLAEFKSCGEELNHFEDQN